MMLPTSIDVKLDASEYILALEAAVERIRQSKLSPAELAQFGQLFGIPPEPVYGPRSPDWDNVRNEVVAEHPFCAASGVKTGLEAHHVVPFHTHPELELRRDNLIVLARPYHFLFGHLCNWSKSNPDVRKDAERWRKLVEAA